MKANKYFYALTDDDAPPEHEDTAGGMDDSPRRLPT